MKNSGHSIFRIVGLVCLLLPGVVFAQTGSLTFTDVLRDDLSGINGLLGVR